MTEDRSWKFDPNSSTILSGTKMPLARIIKWASPKEYVANGHLMAAAPKLLAACKAAQADAKKRKVTLLAVEEAIAEAERLFDVKA